MTMISKYINNRNQALNSNVEPSSTVRYEAVKSLIDKDKLDVNLANKYIRESFSKKLIQDRYSKIVDILEYSNESNNIDNYSKELLLNSFKEALFYMPNTSFDGLGSTVRSRIESSKISDRPKSSLLSLIENIEVADRIINNHEILKGNEVEQEIKKYVKLDDVGSLVEHVAKSIPPTDIKEYQQMNLVFEEVTYLLAPTKKDTKDIARAVYEYYLLHTKEDVEDLKRVIEKSTLLESEDVDHVLGTDECDPEKCSSINAMIQYILTSRDYQNMNRAIYHTLKNTSVIDISTNVYKVFDILDDIYAVELDSVIKDSIKAIKVAIYEKGLTKEELSNIFANIKYAATDKKNRAVCDYINDLVDDLSYNLSNIYSKANINAINFVNQECAESIPLDEFKIFQFNGLLRAVFNLDNYLKEKEKIFLRKAKKKLEPIKNRLTKILFGESYDFRDNIMEFVGSDNKLDICVRQYIDEEFDDMTPTQYAEHVIKDFNNKLAIDNLDTIRCYYVANEGILEIHLKDCRKLELTAEESNEALNTFSQTTMNCMENALYINTLYEHYKDIVVIPTNELIVRINEATNFTEDHFNAAMEAMRYLPVEEAVLEEFGAYSSDLLVESALNESVNEAEVKKIDKYVAEAVNTFFKEDCPLEISLEAYKILLGIFNDAGVNTSPNMPLEEALADDWDDDEDEDEGDGKEDKKEEKKESNKKAASKDKEKDSKNNNGKKPSEILGDGEDLPKDDYKHRTNLNMNNVMLALKGLGAKIKDFSTKQKEVSRTLDMAMKSFIDGIKKADSNERREQIIKGSILPSFSKCMKAGIALILLGVATGGVIVPIITAIGGFALDKKLTEKEKLLILDEIDTELEVIDKELAIADQNNQLNKYRALLKIKKDLQRQYQRIRYNIRVGSDGAMFDSNVGMNRHD